MYLAAKPEAGGIYQYAMSLIVALEKMKQDIDVTCFIENEDWIKYIPSDFQIVMNSPVPWRRALGRFVRKFSFNLWNKSAGIYNRSVRSINKSSCNLIIYPSQDSLTYQSSKPSLTAVHDLMHRYESHFQEYQGKVYQERERHYSAICECASGILVDSEMGKKHVEESYQVSSDRVMILPFVPPMHLLQSKFVDITSKYNLPEQFFFYPAQFWEHKNHLNLIRACCELRRRNKEVHIVFIGSPKNNFQNVKKEIERLEMQNNISILGYIPQDEMYSFYKSATAMVFVSLAGPTNIPPMEAQLLGCPAIVSNAYAMPEQVGKGALLIDAKNPSDIADKMEELISSPTLSEELIRLGSENVHFWDQEKFNERLSNIIHSVI